MNALDLLVDFAALVSISDTSAHHQNGRSNSSDSTHQATQVASFHSGPSGAEHLYAVEEAPRHHVACTLTVDAPSPQLTFSASASQWPNFIAGHYDVHHGPPFHAQQENETQWMFNGDMQQDSRPSLPYQVTSAEPHARVQYDVSPPWDVRYGASYAMPSEAEMRYGPRARQMFPSPHDPDARLAFTLRETLSSKPRCNNGICQCCPPSPQCHYSANNVRPTWDVSGSPYNLDALQSFNEWTLSSDRGEQYERR